MRITYRIIIFMQYVCGTLFDSRDMLKNISMQNLLQLLAEIQVGIRMEYLLIVASVISALQVFGQTA